MNQEIADLIEAIENHPVIDPLNKPEYSTLAAAYAELHEMACKLAGIVKKHNEPTPTPGIPWICQPTTAAELLGQKTVEVEPNGDVTITAIISQPRMSETVEENQ